MLEINGLKSLKINAVHLIYIVSCTLQALPYVMLLIAMLFFIYAIIGMQVILARFSVQKQW